MRFTVTILSFLTIVLAATANAKGPGPAKNGEVRILGDFYNRGPITRVQHENGTKSVFVFSNNEQVAHCEIQASSNEEAVGLLNAIQSGAYVDCYADPEHRTKSTNTSVNSPVYINTSTAVVGKNL